MEMGTSMKRTLDLEGMPKAPLSELRRTSRSILYGELPGTVGVTCHVPSCSYYRWALGVLLPVTHWLA